MATQGQVNPAGLISVGTVAAQNIALALNVKDDPNIDSYPTVMIEKAIKDEITAMSSHFTLAVADLRDNYEIEVAKVKSTFSYVKANKLHVAGVILAAFLAGAVAKAFV